MKKTLILLVGLGLFLLLGYFCVYKISAPKIEADIKKKVEGALIRNGLSSLQVETDGRDIVLKGVVGSEELRAKALRVAAIEGHHHLSSQIEVSSSLPNAKPVLVTPYKISIGLSDDKSLMLSGVVPTNNIKDKLLKVARSRYGKSNVADDLSTRKKAPKHWEDALLSSINVFEWLNHGQLDLSGEELTLSGQTDSLESRALINEYLQENLPANYSGNLDISITPLDNFSPLPVQAGVSKAAQHCQRKFVQLLSEKNIQFKTGKAEIDPSSNNLLNKLVSAAKKCSEQTIIVTGHTDSKGSKEINKILSQKRAQTIVNYFQKEGISKKRLIAQGYGEDKPITTNRTSEGRALNRRIELTVKGVK